MQVDDKCKYWITKLQVPFLVKSKSTQLPCFYQWTYILESTMTQMKNLQCFKQTNISSVNWFPLTHTSLLCSLCLRWRMVKRSQKSYQMF